MLTIQVKSTEVEQRSGNSKKGKPYTMRTQMVWVDLGKAYPVELRVTLGDDQAPFPVGSYKLTQNCFHVNQWNELAVSLRNMQPIAAQKVA